MNEGLLLNRARGFFFFEKKKGEKRLVRGIEGKNQDWPSATRWSHLENIRYGEGLGPKEGGSLGQSAIGLVKNGIQERKIFPPSYKTRKERWDKREKVGGPANMAVLEQLGERKRKKL